MAMCYAFRFNLHRLPIVSSFLKYGHLLSVNAGILLIPSHLIATLVCLQGKTEKRTQGLERRPLPHESHSTQAMPKASQELANAFGQSIRLSADFVTRERDGSRSQSYSNFNSPMHDEEHGMVGSTLVKSKPA